MTDHTVPGEAERPTGGDMVNEKMRFIEWWLAEPDTVQLFANALIVWGPTAKRNEYVAVWRRTLSELLLTEVRRRLTESESGR